MRRKVDRNLNSAGDNRNKSIVSDSVYTNEQIKTFKDEAISVLNILENQGINIYDNNRFGGMYLRQNKDKFIPESLIKSMSNKKDNKKESESDEVNSKDQSFYDKLFKK